MKTIYYNGDIITMENEGGYGDGLITEHGIITYVGNGEDALKQKEEDSLLYNLEGKTLIPAFIDPHGHIAMMAYNLTMCDLSEAADFEDIVRLMKGFKQRNNKSDSDYLMGFGYDHNALREKAHPTKDILDKISTTNPIYISHTSAHMGVANDLALQLAGISNDSLSPAGGVIGRYADTSEINGYVEETAMSIVRESQSNIPVDMAQLVTEVQTEYLKYGITTVQDGASNKEMVELFKYLGSNKKLILDIVAYPMINMNGENITKENKDYIGAYKNHLKIGGYKIVLDGSPQGKSAWMSKPYENEPDGYNGYPWMKDQEVTDWSKIAIDDNLQLLAHCNGDAAAEQYIDGYEKALSLSDNPNKNNLRPTMIHCQTVRLDQLDRMKDLAMIPSIFVAHTYYWGDVHLANLGEERGNRISPAKSAFNRGLVVNFHQDPPVIKPDMLRTIWCGVNRITKEGTCVGESERVTPYEALKAVTINAAYAYFEEQEKGSLKVGKKADLVILSHNPLKIDPLDIKDIKVLETVKDGTSLYHTKADL